MSTRLCILVLQKRVCKARKMAFSISSPSFSLLYRYTSLIAQMHVACMPWAMSMVNGQESFNNKAAAWPAQTAPWALPEKAIM